MMNLGIGLGGLAGGLIASAESPGTFQTLFLLDAFTFLVFVGALAFVPDPPRHDADGHEGRPGSYRDVLRHRIFVGVLALNFVFIFAGMAQLEIVPGLREELRRRERARDRHRRSSPTRS